MLSQTHTLLKLVLPAVSSPTLGIATAAFATRAPRKTAEKLSTAVSVASKRIKPQPPPEKVAEKKKEKTPRPETAYNLFMKDSIAKHRLTDKTTPIRDVFRAAGLQWKTLTPAQKQPYLNKAAESKAQVEAVRTAKKANARPLNVYAKFVQELLPSLKASYPDLPSADLMKRSGDAWKLVSPAEKARRKDAYAVSVAEWKARMEQEK